MEKRPVAVGLILLTLLLVTTGAYLYLRTGKTSEEAYRAAYEEGRRLYKAGEWIVAEQKFREVLNFTSDPVENAEIKGRLAGSLFQQDPSGTGGREAVLLWKEIARDPALPRSTKARALNDLAFLYDLGATDEFLRTVVFSEEPYGSYLRGTEGAIEGAVRKLYEEADTLAPTAFSKLEIAFTYTTAFFYGKKESNLDPKKIALRIQHYVKEAEPLMDAQLYSRSTFAHLYLLRAANLSVSNMILHNINYSEIEQAFQQALAIAGEGTDIYSRRIFLNAAFFFARNLAAQFGNARADEIKTLILPLLSSDYLRNVARSVLVLPDAAPIKVSFLNLAQVSPEFRTLLTEQGWRIMMP